MNALNTLLRDVRALFVSLRLTVVLLLLSIILILVATLDQVNLGIWVVQAKYFNTFIVFWQVGDMSLAVFPGGYTLGGLLLVNLVAAQASRFQFTWRKLGIWLTHAGLVLLLIGQLLTALWQDEYQMRLDQGETKNYSESYRNIELAITDTTDPQFDDVVAIPEAPLARKKMVQHPKLPFRVAVHTYLPNAALQEAKPSANTPTGPATQGVGPRIIVTPVPLTFKHDERNLPGAYVELTGPDGPVGTWLVSPLLEPQRFEFAGRTWKIALRFARHYKPYSLTLLKFSHDRYVGTEIPKNFSSRLRLTTPDGRDDREVLIYMNNPLRYAGLTFYQAGFANNDMTTVLQVVRNPSWLIPYLACGVMTLGLGWQFSLHLVGFVGKRRRPANGTAPDAASAPAPAGPRWPAARLVAILVPALAALLVASSLFPRAPKSDYDLGAFGRLPTLVNGRVKPLDTVARTTLLVLQGRQRVTAKDGRTLQPVEWLLEMLYRPAAANAYTVFEVVHPDVLTLFNLTPEQGAGKKRFSFTQLTAGLPELERQGRLADAVEHPVRSPFQRAVVQLRNNLLLYQSLQMSLLAPGADNYLDRLARFDHALPGGLAAEQAKKAGQPHDAAAAKALLEMRVSFATLEQFGHLLLIPPETNQADLTAWQNTGAALLAGVNRGRLDAATAGYIRIGLAWRDHQPAAFTAAVHDYRARLEPEIPALLQKSDLETRFNAAQPFYTSAVLYVAAFLLAVFSWLRWPEALGRSAHRLVVLAWILTTAGIATRMWLEGRPVYRLGCGRALPRAGGGLPERHRQRLGQPHRLRHAPHRAPPVAQRGHPRDDARRARLQLLAGDPCRHGDHRLLGDLPRGLSRPDLPRARHFHALARRPDGRFAGGHGLRRGLLRHGLQLRRHRARRHLGRPVLGPLLGLGSEGERCAHHRPLERPHPPRPLGRSGAAARADGARHLRQHRDRVELVRHQYARRGPAQLRFHGRRILVAGRVRRQPVGRHRPGRSASRALAQRPGGLNHSLMSPGSN